MTQYSEEVRLGLDNDHATPIQLLDLLFPPSLTQQLVDATNAQAEAFYQDEHSSQTRQHKQRCVSCTARNVFAKQRAKRKPLGELSGSIHHGNVRPRERPRSRFGCLTCKVALCRKNVECWKAHEQLVDGKFV